MGKITFLPNDIIVKIFSLLDLRTLMQVSATCKQFQKITETASLLWRISFAQPAMRRLGMPISSEGQVDCGYWKKKAVECFRLERLLHTHECAGSYPIELKIKKAWWKKSVSTQYLIKEIHAFNGKLIVVWPHHIELRDTNTFNTEKSLSLQKFHDKFKTGYIQTKEPRVKIGLDSVENVFKKTVYSYLEAPFLVVAGQAHKQPKTRVVDLNKFKICNSFLGAEPIHLFSGVVTLLQPSNTFNILFYDLKQQAVLQQHIVSEIPSRKVSYLHWKTSQHLWLYVVDNTKTPSNTPPFFTKINYSTRVVSTCTLDTQNFKIRPSALSEFIEICESEEGSLIICRKEYNAAFGRYSYLVDVHAADGTFLKNMMRTEFGISHLSLSNQTVLGTLYSLGASMLWKCKVDVKKEFGDMKEECIHLGKESIVSLKHIGNYAIVSFTQQAVENKYASSKSKLVIWDVESKSSISHFEHCGRGFTQFVLTEEALIGLQEQEQFDWLSLEWYRRDSILWNFRSVPFIKEKESKT